MSRYISNRSFILSMLRILSIAKRAFIYLCLCLPSFLFLPSVASAYSPSFALEQKSYSGFTENGYAYSSLFRSGRDGFHWLDLGYTQAQYLTDDEIGNSASYTSVYRFVHRQRWHRFFKPAIVAGAGLSRRNLTNRYAVRDNLLRGRLSDRTRTEALLSFGAGYLWEVRQVVVGVSMSYGYDFGYGEDFVVPAFFFSYQL